MNRATEHQLHEATEASIKPAERTYDSHATRRRYRSAATGTATRNHNSHPNMLVKFGKALGMSKEEMHRAPILGCTKAWLDELIGRCENSLVEALAGNNLTAELFNTVVFPRVIDGLRNKYHFNDDELEFFKEHSDPEVEGEHVENGARLLAERIKTEEDAVKAEWTSRFTMYAIQDYYRRIHEHMIEAVPASRAAEPTH